VRETKVVRLFSQEEGGIVKIKERGND